MSVGVELPVGSELLGYQIEAVLGRGGMGIVYRAEHLRLKRKVALKLLPPELAEDDRFRKRFLRESELAASLDHPHILPVYDAGEVAGQLYIAMRYVPGGDLRRLLHEEGPLEPRRALALLAQVAEALDAAHEAGLVHRDVKPANVMLDPHDRCYLSDFGLTKQVSSESGFSATGQIVGTIDYVAPEVIEGRELTASADLYALGCVLYECFAGAPPFRRESEFAVLWAHVNEPPPKLSDRRPELPAELDEVVAKALGKAPERRYGSAGELVQAAAGALPEAPPAPPGSKRRRRLLAVAAAALVALAVALPLALLGGTQTSRAKPTTLLDADSLQRIDPASRRLSATIPVGSQPQAVAVGLGAVWVITKDDRTLLEIDPKKNTIVRKVSLDGFAPDWLAIGEGAVWMAQGTTGIPGEWLWKYDPHSRSVAPVHTGDIIPADLNVGAGWVWLDDYVRLPEPLLRIRPTAPGRPVRVEGCACTAPAFAEGAAWVLAWPRYDVLGPTGVYRIGPETGRILKKIDLGFHAGRLAVGEGGAWVTNPLRDEVTRIDQATNRVSGRFPTGRDPFSIAAGAGAVWVTNSRDGTVTRYDPESADIETIRVGGTPGAIAVGAGGVWVTTEAR